MSKTFITNKPAVNFTIVGFGQAGSRIADQFARFKDDEGKQIYNCLALNSNDGDLKELQFIHPDNRYSLELGGLGKNPEKAIKILDEKAEVKEKMHRFITQKVRPQDQAVIFVAGLGGGTGTSTIIKAIEEFNNYYNKPVITEELLKLIKTEGKEKFQKNQNEFTTRALMNALEREDFKKIIVIATLPLRSDGADVLRQVNHFAQKIWNLAKDPTKGIAHVVFPDNQYFYDKFKKINRSKNHEIQNYRDYANKEIVNIIHELNTGATEGGTSVTLDATDLRRIWLEHTGTMFYSKIDVLANKIENENDLVEMFERAFNENSLHGPVNLITDKDGQKIAKKIYHIGLFAVVDDKNDYGKGAFLEAAKEKFSEKFIISGNTSVFPGYIENENNKKISVYVFYKADALPERLEKGLVTEYEEYVKRQQDVSFEKVQIQQIKKEDNLDLKISLEELGIADNEELKVLLGETESNDELNDEDIDIDIDNLLQNVDLDQVKKSMKN